MTGPRPQIGDIVNGKYKLIRARSERGALGCLYEVEQVGKSRKTSIPDGFGEGSHGGDNYAGMWLELISPEKSPSGPEMTLAGLKRFAELRHPTFMSCVEIGKVYTGRLRDFIFVLTRNRGKSISQLIGLEKSLDAARSRELARDVLAALHWLQERGAFLSITHDHLWYEADRWWVGPAVCPPSPPAVPSRGLHDLLEFLEERAGASPPDDVGRINSMLSDIEHDKLSLLDGYLQSTDGGVPPLVSDLSMSGRSGHSCSVCWTKPPIGDVELVDWKTEDTPRPGSIWLGQNLGDFGSVARGDPPLRIQVAPDRPSRLVPATRFGEVSVLGHPLLVSYVEDVQDLLVVPMRAGISLRWRWPENTDMAMVVMRDDQRPSGPEDRAQPNEPCLVLRNKAPFGSFFPKKNARYYGVYAAQASNGKREYAAGVFREIRPHSLGTVKYQCRRMGLLGNAFQLVLTACDDVELPETSLVIGDEYPLEIGDGETVLTLPAGTLCLQSEPVIREFRAPPGQHHWRARLLARDPSKSDHIWFVSLDLTGA